MTSLEVLGRGRGGGTRAVAVEIDDQGRVTVGGDDAGSGGRARDEANLGVVRRTDVVDDREQHRAVLLRGRRLPRGREARSRGGERRRQ